MEMIIIALSWSSRLELKEADKCRKFCSLWIQHVFQPSQHSLRSNQDWPGTLTVTPRKPLSSLGSSSRTGDRRRISFLKSITFNLNSSLSLYWCTFIVKRCIYSTIYVCWPAVAFSFRCPRFEIETKFYSKLWAALQEFATFYIWSTETKYIVFFGKCLVKRKYESFWQSLNLSPAEGFESHIRPKSDVFPLLKITQFEFWRVSKTRPFKFSVKSWRGVLATIRNNPSTKHGEPFRLILGSDKSSPTYLVSHSLQVIFLGTIDLEMICKPLADG